MTKKNPANGLQPFDVPGTLGRMARTHKELNGLIMHWQYMRCGGVRRRGQKDAPDDGFEATGEDQRYGWELSARMDAILYEARILVADLKRLGLYQDFELDLEILEEADGT